jgi:hypothetical protein
MPAASSPDCMGIGEMYHDNQDHTVLLKVVHFEAGGFSGWT